MRCSITTVRKATRELLLGYGFAEINNRFDQVQLKVGAKFECPEENENAKEALQSVLKRCGSQAEVSISICPLEEENILQVSAGPFFLKRVLVADDLDDDGLLRLLAGRLRGGLVDEKEGYFLGALPLDLLLFMLHLAHLSSSCKTPSFALLGSSLDTLAGLIRSRLAQSVEAPLKRCESEKCSSKAEHARRYLAGQKEVMFSAALAAERLADALEKRVEEEGLEVLTEDESDESEREEETNDEKQQQEWWDIVEDVVQSFKS